MTLGARVARIATPIPQMLPRVRPDANIEVNAWFQLLTHVADGGVGASTTSLRSGVEVSAVFLQSVA